MIVHLSLWNSYARLMARITARQKYQANDQICLESDLCLRRKPNRMGLRTGTGFEQRNNETDYGLVIRSPEVAHGFYLQQHGRLLFILKIKTLFVDFQERRRLPVPLRN